MSERLIYEDIHKRIYVTAEATDDTPQQERYEWIDGRPPEDRIAAAAAALASIDTLAAPVLPVDVLDVLTDVRTALEG